MAARVARISIAPVKALGLVHPDEVELSQSGVAGDRRFWLCNSEGRLVNCKTHGELMLVRVAWDEETRRLALAFPGGETIEDVVEPGQPVAAVLYGLPHPSRSVAGPWQDALSRYAGEPLTLLWSDEGAVDRGVGDGAVTLVSQASLERLREEARSEEAVDGRRFRMLFEIDGVRAYEEDEWIGARVAVGDAVVSPVGDVGRCVVTTRNPDTGVSDLETLKVLARYRREGRTEPLPLGVHGTVVVPGRVRVGDPVRPLLGALADPA
ncbi:MAG TPA: MOSC N-terminal beta barrel domain-containing protein [Gaiellaceae bacterium]|nr:MOSC N-terminal beta barrel domain-containing protein [Gaiellaceae bacterium]